MGAGSLRDLFDERYYQSLEGGILESFGRLFKNDLRLYIYPLLEKSGALTTAKNLAVHERLKAALRVPARKMGSIRQLDDINQAYLHIPLARRACTRSAPVTRAGKKWFRPRWPR